MSHRNPKTYQADWVVIGTGIFGLYAAKLLTQQNKKVVILEKGNKPFTRASAINQARVHNGYHYPRSYDTAKKVVAYYERFSKDFAFSINKSFEQIYAIASEDSKTDTQQFIDFCKEVGIPFQNIDIRRYFKDNAVEAAFITREYSFDFTKIRQTLLDSIGSNAHYIYGARIKRVDTNSSSFYLTLENGLICSAPQVLNATYFGINEIIEKFGHQLFDVKYELCEVAYCTVPAELKSLGITVMDGDYFSLMPFGNNDIHSFTSVRFTPRITSYDPIPTFPGKKLLKDECVMHGYNECIVCSQNLGSAWNSMQGLSKKYLKRQFDLKYARSQFEIKTILKASEKDDSRPTVIHRHTKGEPNFISVFSGKLSTIYDLEDYLI